MCAFAYLVLEMIFSEEFVYSDDPAGGWGVGADQYVKKAGAACALCSDP